MATETPTPKSWEDLTYEELRHEVSQNHIWLNAFKCIRPTDEFLMDVGRAVLNMLDDSDLRDSFIHRMPEVVIRVNKS